MGVVIGAVAVVFVLALIIFPGVRGKLKVLVGGFLNIFVEDIAKRVPRLSSSKLLRKRRSATTRPVIP
jgi:hypothetical protein